MGKFDMIIGCSAVKKELLQPKALAEKNLLTTADVQEIKNSCKIVPVVL